MSKEQQTKVRELIQLAEEAIKNGGGGSFNAEINLKQAELYIQLASLIKEI